MKSGSAATPSPASAAEHDGMSSGRSSRRPGDTLGDRSRTDQARAWHIFKWQRAGSDLAGRGSGRALARLAAAFGMRLRAT